MISLKTFYFSYRQLIISCLLLFAGASFSIEAKIVFTTDGDIYVMNDDGTGRRRLTKSTTETHRYPRWSPDGTKIAFTRYMDKENRQFTSELFIMNADGTDPQRLTDNKVADIDSSWSPDGQRIAFTSGLGGRYQVYIIEVSTRAVTQLTGIDDETGSTAPDWSPNGTQITFERFIQVPNGIAPKTIYVMSADGQHQRPILPDPPLNGPPTFRFFPRWSTDGKRILFYEDKWFKEGDVVKFFVQQIGGAKKEITDINNRLGNNLFLAGTSWMENDRAILVSIKIKDKPNANYDLYRYTFDTRGLRRLTRDPGDEEWPDWTEGTLSVSAHGKLSTQWAEIKHAYHE